MKNVSGDGFAELAARWPATVDEHHLTLVRESDLPEDWLDITVDCYSTESGYYSLALYGELEPMKDRINEYIAQRMASADCRAVLDAGVGDGHRLVKICSIVDEHGSPRPRMYGIELSERMIDEAERRGVDVVRQDMRNGVPDFGPELDCILFLSGDFGYLMDPIGGHDLRLRVLDSAYERLSAHGLVFMELLTLDPKAPHDGADVYFFSRVPSVTDPDQPTPATFHGPETWQYVKTFTLQETRSLIEASRFDLDKSSLQYIVRASPDKERIGSFVEDSAITEEEAYRILVVLPK